MFNSLFIKIAYHTLEIHCFLSKYILYFQFDKRLQSVQSSLVVLNMIHFYNEILNILYRFTQWLHDVSLSFKNKTKQKKKCHFCQRLHWYKHTVSGFGYTDKVIMLSQQRKHYNNSSGNYSRNQVSWDCLVVSIKKKCHDGLDLAF